MAGFRSTVWDPVLISAQIVTMQSIFYITLGSWVFVMDYIGGTYRSLDQLFGYSVSILHVCVCVCLCATVACNNPSGHTFESP